jgi:hypothetical protein
MSVFPRTRTRWLLWTLIPAALFVFAAANIHLVYVAVTSQPDCVPHLKVGLLKG